VVVDTERERLGEGSDAVVEAKPEKKKPERTRERR
jgi:hypothetical protein